MTLADETKTIEATLRDAGIGLEDVLAHAGVDRSTWTRWKNGAVKYARYDTITKVKAAADQALANARAQAA